MITVSLVVIYAALFLLIAFLDFKFKRIPNLIVFGGMLFAIVANSVLLPNGWQGTLIGGGIGIGIAALFTLAARITKSKMGAGDSKLIILVGLATGYPIVLISMTAGAVLAAAVSIFMLAARIKQPKDGIAFGTYLSVATVGVFTVSMLA